MSRPSRERLHITHRQIVSRSKLRLFSNRLIFSAQSSKPVESLEFRRASISVLAAIRRDARRARRSAIFSSLFFFSIVAQKQPSALLRSLPARAGEAANLVSSSPRSSRRLAAGERRMSHAVALFGRTRGDTTRIISCRIPLSVRLHVHALRRVCAFAGRVVVRVCGTTTTQRISRSSACSVCCARCARLGVRGAARRERVHATRFPQTVLRFVDDVSRLSSSSRALARVLHCSRDPLFYARCGRATKERFPASRRTAVSCARIARAEKKNCITR